MINVIDIPAPHMVTDTLIMSVVRLFCITVGYQLV